MLILKVKPKPLIFVAVGRSVLRGAEHVAQVCSGTMAKRIASALNRYKPDRRGQ